MLTLMPTLMLTLIRTPVRCYDRGTAWGGRRHTFSSFCVYLHIHHTALYPASTLHPSFYTPWPHCAYAYANSAVVPSRPAAVAGLGLGLALSLGLCLSDLPRSQGDLRSVSPILGPPQIILRRMEIRDRSRSVNSIDVVFNFDCIGFTGPYRLHYATNPNPKRPALHPAALHCTEHLLSFGHWFHTDTS